MKKRAAYVKPKTEVLLLYKEDVVTGSLDWIKEPAPEDGDTDIDASDW